ncbi:Signal transduction histidine kinase [Pseudomonas sp. 8Z]|uniref:ATP-binding protein n=1 Tax=Pseudomonas sp. 8Z TaxID=2653166 RepID=UPI0012F2379A|nr:ATP-binding protein [Pseudomonas sp. 8Z]VXC17510.1 Signal transduction histidine kinase [Pseudomonas sp. 8Z]
MNSTVLQQRLVAAVEQIPAGFLLLDAAQRVLYCNPFIVQRCPRDLSMVSGMRLAEAFPEIDTPRWRELFQRVSRERQPVQTIWRDQPYLILLSCAQGDEVCSPLPMLQATLLFPVLSTGDSLILGLAIFDNSRAASNPALQQALMALRGKHDELSELSGKLQTANRQLLQSEKMAAIGQLAAGVAHEINNPVGFVASNLKTLAGYVQQLLQLVDQMSEWGGLELQRLKQQFDYDFIRDDINGLLSESTDGVERVKRIISSLRDFSHSDDEIFVQADLHEGIRSTLNVVNNEVKYKAEVVCDFAELPLVECIPAQINQVVMNLLVNAAQAIEHDGRIVIHTERNADDVLIQVSDNGCGIAAQHLAQIFDPFFTTKPVGKGTGLGLALSFSIVEKHGGSLTVSSEVGRGAVFTIRLPIRQGR